MSEAKPKTPVIVVFPRPWLGPRSELHLEHETIRGHVVTLQARDLASLKRVSDRCVKRGAPFSVHESFRTHARQRELWKESDGGKKWACAPPGYSYHEQGLSADIVPGVGGTIDIIRAEFKREGWHQFNTSTDPYHFSRPVTG